MNFDAGQADLMRTLLATVRFTYNEAGHVHATAKEIADRALSMYTDVMIGQVKKQADKATQGK